MPDLIPIPGFSPEDIKRKARSALEKLRDNYHLVSTTEATCVKPLESTKLVSSFIKHINELHTVEVSADKWSSELMGITARHALAWHKRDVNIAAFDSSSCDWNLVNCNIQHTGSLAYHARALQDRVMLLNYVSYENTVKSADLSDKIQHFDRELDSADHLIQSSIVKT